MIEWEAVDPPTRLVVVLCTRCFCCSAMYYAVPRDLSGGYWEAGTCTCEPAAARPSETELAASAARAVRQGKPVTVRQ